MSRSLRKRYRKNLQPAERAEELKKLLAELPVAKEVLEIVLSTAWPECTAEKESDYPCPCLDCTVDRDGVMSLCPDTVYRVAF